MPAQALCPCQLLQPVDCLTRHHIWVDAVAQEACELGGTGFKGFCIRSQASVISNFPLTVMFAETPSIALPVAPLAATLTPMTPSTHRASVGKAGGRCKTDTVVRMCIPQ